MKIWMQRGLRGLEAHDDMGVEVLRRLKQGATVQVEITKPRNILHHRKFFALLNLVWSTSGEWKNVDALLDDLKKRMGFYEELGELTDSATGEIVKVVKLKSIAFARMDQLMFDSFYEQALRELCAMAGGIEFDVLRNEVLNQLAAA